MQAVLLSVQAEHHPVLGHGVKDFVADPMIERHSMLGIGGAVRRIIFASSQQSAGSAAGNHLRCRLRGEVEGNDHLIEIFGPGAV